MTAGATGSRFAPFVIIVNESSSAAPGLHFVHEFAVKWVGRWTGLVTVESA
jgi:hypothetical protein